jgi:hypothetical protein
MPGVLGDRQLGAPRVSGELRAAWRRWLAEQSDGAWHGVCLAATADHKPTVGWVDAPPGDVVLMGPART